MSELAGAWVMRHGGVEVSTDELTLDELDVIERSCGTPYLMFHPLQSARQAKAMLAVMLIRGKVAGGMPREQAETESLEAAGQIQLGELHGCFDWRPPTKPAAPTEPDPVPPLSAPTSEAG